MKMKIFTLKHHIKTERYMVQEKTIIEVGLKSKMLFKNAKLESIYKLYNKSGNLRFEMPIENNKRESTAIFY
ncbi:hypothetical protein [Helicobacter bilis]|uniref:hypothetical protein n=2 Tax=Helicobacter bilis TaxID=37372 RepID=UPI00051DA383|nr:hypothetical protein [Helicobacter bilis]MCI7410762.1 hypothetical protein [Helicobacter bilis]MDD7296043.1 hypothetical protein [Helicobacter bilis]MDY4399409.1 hypothetical protein [Helicobacter bilis]